MKSLMSLLGKGLALLVVAAYGFGFLIETGYAPSDRVQTHEEIGDKHLQVLLDEGIIGKDEHIQHFYSEGLLSVREGGSILTESRVIAYQEWDEEIDIIDLTIDEGCPARCVRSPLSSPTSRAPASSLGACPRQSITSC